jgi:phosphatidylserine decarboxylase
MNDEQRPGASPGSPTIGNRIFVGLQHVIPQHALSRLVHRVARSRTRGVKNALIGSFVRGFRPHMADAVEPDPLRYASFNEFFTRALKAGARAVDTDPDVVVSPVDGIVSQIGSLEANRLLQAKNRYYALADLLGGESSWAAHFTGGAFATLYLAPYNYHRIHMPLDGRLVAARLVPGRLFSVNAVTAASVAGLFARNERIVCMFENDRTAFAIVLVGALFVGSMATVWHGDVTPRRPRQACDLNAAADASPLELRKGMEMGRFNMGSTVILLFPRATVDWHVTLAAGSKLRVGEPIARLRR